MEEGAQGRREGEGGNVFLMIMVLLFSCVCSFVSGYRHLPGKGDARLPGEPHESVEDSKDKGDASNDPHAKVQVVGCHCQVQQDAQQQRSLH